MMTPAILQAALDLRQARAGIKVPVKPESRFKPEMETRGDASDYRRGQGLGVPWMSLDLAENRAGEPDGKDIDLWNPKARA